MRAWLILLMLSACLAGALGISCYHCESETHTSCLYFRDPEEMPQIDCDAAPMPQYLHKFERRLPATGCITKVFSSFKEKPFYVRRTCYYDKLDNTEEACGEQDPYVPWVELQHCEVCEGDLCNTHSASVGSNLKAPIWGLSIALMLSWMGAVLSK